mgnify:CR=1 FL=1
MPMPALLTKKQQAEFMIANSAAMAAAPVGDDVYGDDPTVNRLQELAAEVRATYLAWNVAGWPGRASGAAVNGWCLKCAPGCVHHRYQAWRRRCLCPAAPWETCSPSCATAARTAPSSSAATTRISTTTRAVRMGQRDMLDAWAVCLQCTVTLKFASMGCHCRWICIAGWRPPTPAAQPA